MWSAVDGRSPPIKDTKLCFLGWAVTIHVVGCDYIIVTADASLYVGLILSIICIFVVSGYVYVLCVRYH